MYERISTVTKEFWLSFRAVLIIFYVLSMQKHVKRTPVQSGGEFAFRYSCHICNSLIVMQLNLWENEGYDLYPPPIFFDTTECS